ncbi:MAG TPA: ATP-binding cassette domain-containing protein, partial [Bacteroidia bacterium]|nr:ATP-binding cassette domain-containing protein [Bacteroidia bacterium]
AIDNTALPLIAQGFLRKDANRKANEILEQLGMDGRKNHKPAELSGGEQQRVAIARALISQPAVILADEPTGNLDSKTSSEIMSLFEEIHTRGNTIIVVTHEEDIARYAHRIVRIKDGMIESDARNPNITRADRPLTENA